MQLGYSNFSGVSLLADYQTNTAPPPVGDTVEITPRAYGYPGYWAYYSYQVPIGKTSITLETSSAIGDLSLFVKKDSQVSETQFDCKSELSGTGQSCTLAVTPGQNLNIGLLGITSYDWVKLVAKHQPFLEIKSVKALYFSLIVSLLCASNIIIFSKRASF